MALAACCKSLEGEIELTPVRDAGQREAKRGWFIALGEKIAEREKVAERFRHLLAFNKEMLGVQPVTRKRLAGGGFALRNFVFVMWECQVDSAGVNIERLAKIFHGHGGAFDVPAGTAGTDRSLPEMLARLRRFPEREVAGAFFFVTIVIHARAGLDTADVDL